MRLASLRSIIYSVILHAAAFGLLVISFDLTPVPRTRPIMNANIVKAVSIDNKQVAAELQRLKDIEQEKQRKQQALEKKLADLEKKTAAATKKRKTEERRLKALQQKKTAAEVTRKLELKKLAEIKKQKAELEKQHKLAEQSRRKEEERKLLEEKKKREVAEQKRLAEEKLQQELAEEQRQLEQAQQSDDQALINQFLARIINVITREFNKTGMPSGLSCVLQIRLIPGGDVVDVRIAKSSGNDIFDRRAETAVKKAAPLPTPDNPRIFEKMRKLRILFDPQN